MKAFINQIRAAIHHGRGSKYTRQKNFKLALEHFQAAAKYAINSNGQASVALEIECIARTFARLGDFVKAKENAQESLRLYNLEAPGSAIDESIGRVSRLLETLKEKSVPDGG
jgi:tetratricopeptide (TPR) repeat protein